MSRDKDDHDQELAQSEQPKENLKVVMYAEVHRLGELVIEAQSIVSFLMQSGLGDLAEIDIRASIDLFIASGELPKWWPESYSRYQKIRLRRRLYGCQRFKTRVEARVAGRMLRRITECQHVARETLASKLEELGATTKSLASDSRNPHVSTQLWRLWEVCELVEQILFRDLAFSNPPAGETEVYGSIRSLAPGIRAFLCGDHS